MPIEFLSEFEAIRRLGEATGANAATVLGIGDDAALLNAPRAVRLCTAHTVISDFEVDGGAREAERLGARAVSVALNRLAASGATPAWMTLALTLPEIRGDWLTSFARGLGARAGHFRAALVGGDTTAGAAMIALWALGTAPPASAEQTAPKPGDRLLWVTARVPDDGATPLPCVAEGSALLGLAHAMYAVEGEFGAGFPALLDAHPELTVGVVRPPPSAGHGSLALCAAVSGGRIASAEAALRKLGASARVVAEIVTRPGSADGSPAHRRRPPRPL